MEDENLVGTKDYHEYLDKQVIILLWDGKYLYGTLRSFDQFNSITLEEVYEMWFHDIHYTYENHKVFVVRGENVVMLGTGKFNTDNFQFMKKSDFLEKYITN